MKYKIILWDADGVVLKSSRRFSEQLETDYGIKRSTLQPFFTGVFRDCTLGRSDLKEALANVITHWGWKGTVEELMEYWFTKGTQMDEEVIAYVQSVRALDIHCFMASDQEKYRGEYLQNLLGDGKVFEKVFYSAEIGHVKKEVAFFECIYNTINKKPLVSKDETLFIDDDEKNVEVAKIFGYDGYVYKDLQSLKAFLTLP